VKTSGALGFDLSLDLSNPLAANADDACFFHGFTTNGSSGGRGAAELDEAVEGSEHHDGVLDPVLGSCLDTG
jgi:hypothetical protein